MPTTEVSNYFIKEVESKYLGRNPFKKFTSYLRYKKFIKKVRSWSPSIGSLWFFADFVKLAEKAYFFDNRRDSKIFSSSSYEYGENGFIITDEKSNIRINCKLYTNTQKVMLEVKRLNGSNMTTVHILENGIWNYNPDGCDEILIDNVIGVINSAIIYVFDFCYKRKGNFDYVFNKKELYK